MARHWHCRSNDSKQRQREALVTATNAYLNALRDDAGDISEAWQTDAAPGDGLPPRYYWADLTTDVVGQSDNDTNDNDNSDSGGSSGSRSTSRPATPS